MAAAHPSPVCKSDLVWQLRRAILYYAALEDRNRSAGQALQLFFKSAELETQIALLRHDRATTFLERSKKAMNS